MELTNTHMATETILWLTHLAAYFSFLKKKKILAKNVQLYLYWDVRLMKINILIWFSSRQYLSNVCFDGARAPMRAFVCF